MIIITIITHVSKLGLILLLPRGMRRMASIHVVCYIVLIFVFFFFRPFPVDAIARTESGADLLFSRRHVQCHYDHYNSHLLI